MFCSQISWMRFEPIEQEKWSSIALTGTDRRNTQTHTELSSGRECLNASQPPVPWAKKKQPPEQMKRLVKVESSKRMSGKQESKWRWKCIPYLASLGWMQCHETERAADYGASQREAGAHEWKSAMNILVKCKNFYNKEINFASMT